MIADTASSLSAWWAPILAFVAGFVSFASPCVLPLVPGYVSFVTGESIVDGVPEGRRRWLPMALFIAGFTTVFTLFGAFASTFVQIFKGRPGQIVAGIVVVAMGLLLIGYATRRGTIAMYAERRPFLEKVKPGVAGAYPLGMAFDEAQSEKIERAGVHSPLRKKRPVMPCGSRRIKTMAAPSKATSPNTGVVTKVAI